jgi:hypothetical protein
VLFCYNFYFYYVNCLKKLKISNELKKKKLLFQFTIKKLFVKKYKNIDIHFKWNIKSLLIVPSFQHATNVQLLINRIRYIIKKLDLDLYNMLLFWFLHYILFHKFKPIAVFYFFFYKKILILSLPFCNTYIIYIHIIVENNHHILWMRDNT